MTDCLDVMAPNDEALLKHIVDEEPLPALKKAHLDQCAICQQRLATYEMTNDWLLGQLYRSQCPSPTRIGHYSAKLLSAEEARFIGHHLEICPLCATDAADMYNILTVEMLLEDKTELSLYTDRAFVGHREEDVRQLVYDGGAKLTQGQRWHYQGQWGTVEIFLSLSYDTIGVAHLRGEMKSLKVGKQVVSFAGATVELHRIGDVGLYMSDRQVAIEKEQRTLWSIYIESMEDILFHAIPDGEYFMIVYLAEIEIVLEGLTVSHYIMDWDQREE